jgi:hypothetical protein
VISPTDAAWAAGFLEGEGHFGWWGDTSPRGWNLRGYPLVAASQNNRAPLDRLASLFGFGEVRLQSKTKAGNDHFEWRVINVQAIDVMVAVFRQMSTKRQGQIKEIVATYAEREASKVAEFLRRQEACPRGHLRAEHGVLRNVRGGMQWSCRRCSRDRARIRRAEARA